MSPFAKNNFNELSLHFQLSLPLIFRLYRGKPRPATSPSSSKNLSEPSVAMATAISFFAFYSLHASVVFARHSIDASGARISTYQSWMLKVRKVSPRRRGSHKRSMLFAFLQCEAPGARTHMRVYVCVLVQSQAPAICCVLPLCPWDVCNAAALLLILQNLLHVHAYTAGSCNFSASLLCKNPTQ